MSQEDVFNLLKRTRRWMDAKEIARKLEISHKSSSANLKRIWDTTDDLERKQMKKRLGGLVLLWRIKRGIKNGEICV